jgi:hypothetical protein
MRERYKKVTEKRLVCEAGTGGRPASYSRKYRRRREKRRKRKKWK